MGHGPDGDAVGGKGGTAPEQADLPAFEHLGDERAAPNPNGDGDKQHGVPELEPDIVAERISRETPAMAVNERVKRDDTRIDERNDQGGTVKTAFPNAVCCKP